MLKETCTCYLICLKCYCQEAIFYFKNACESSCKIPQKETNAATKIYPIEKYLGDVNYCSVATNILHGTSYC